MCGIWDSGLSCLSFLVWLFSSSVFLRGRAANVLESSLSLAANALSILTLCAVYTQVAQA
jgi:hypothetical protein